MVSMYLIKKVKLPLIGRRNFETWGIILAYKFYIPFAVKELRIFFNLLLTYL